MVTSDELAPVDVLIAEDDDLLRQSLRLILELSGYTCAEAGNGREAVEVAYLRRPRCVLLDLAMPEMDGFTVTRLLRSHPRTRTAHIHCVTGLTDPQSRQRAEDAGCERFLTKPVDPAVLLEVLSRARENVEAVSPAGARGTTAPLFDTVSGLTLEQAEGLLDWLQNQGCTQMQVSLEGEGVTVRCQCPPGHRLVRDEDGSVRLLPS